jgi:methionine synthase I (cobalamin-dependent)
MLRVLFDNKDLNEAFMVLDGALGLTVKCTALDERRYKKQ